MGIDEKIIRNLIRAAKGKLADSYAPYSKFHVAAALLASDGTIYTGINIENASYGLCNCAERTAIFSAVEKGVKDFTAICIMGAPEEEVQSIISGGAAKDYCPPCGACRQVMSEFCKEDFVVVLAKSEEDYKTYTLGELLPVSFSL